jgi:hypothetical protein
VTSPDGILQLARQSFPAYYVIASPAEGAALDTLVVARTAFLISTSSTRVGLSANDRATLERTTDKAEHIFLEFRDVVRHSGSFQGLPEREREAMERDLFELGPRQLG